MFFFNTQICGLNPTLNTLIPDHPTRFLFLAPFAKYLDDIFPNPNLTQRYPFEAPNIHSIDRTGIETVLYFVFVVNLSSFLLFAGVH